MKEVKHNQRLYIKYYVGLNKTASETYYKLKEQFGKNCFARSRVFLWHKRFREGREDLTDNNRSGRPGTAINYKNIIAVTALVEKYNSISVRQISRLLNISRSSVHTMLTNYNIRNEVPRYAIKIFKFIITHK